MTWEEIIIDIRTKPEYKDLVRLAYFEADLKLNVERFTSGEEYHATLQIFKKYIDKTNANILDIGAGNGVSTVPFALAGYNVTALEPDKSMTIGSGAIKIAANQFNLSNITVVESFAETMPFADGTFDIVYARQSMHHAYNLPAFVKEAGRVLKKGGILVTVRDHVVNDEAQKKAFLEIHPLHKFYGEYTAAIEGAGLSIKEQLGPCDSPINYFPASKNSVTRFKIPVPNFVFSALLSIRKAWTNNLNAVPGRLYSFVATK
jgi:ubiquinone/menaquinone biosynthesis C-methylase UbiE